MLSISHQRPLLLITLIFKGWHLHLQHRLDPCHCVIVTSVCLFFRLDDFSIDEFRNILLATLKQMLNLNTNPSSILRTTSADLAWKVLVYDELGQDIISPLLTVKELRDLGVTLHV